MLKEKSVTRICMLYDPIYINYLRQIYRGRKQMSGCLGLSGELEVTRGVIKGFPSEVMK